MLSPCEFEPQSLAHSRNLSLRLPGHLQQKNRFYCFQDFELNFHKKSNCTVKILEQSKGFESSIVNDETLTKNTIQILLNEIFELVEDANQEKWKCSLAKMI